MKDKILQDFYDLTIHDPLFAAEGVDLKNAQEALENLEAITKELQIVDTTFLGRMHFLVHPLTETLHPLRFLRVFLQAEQARRDFLGDPTLQQAIQLSKIHFLAVDALEKDLSSFREAVLHAQKKTSQKNSSISQYLFNNRSFTFDEFILSIDVMKENAKELRLEVKKRQQLLSGDIRKLIRRFPKNQQNHQDENMTTSLKKVEELEWTVMGRDFMYYLKKRYGKIKTEFFGPFTHKLSQFDSYPTDHEFFIAIIKDSHEIPRYFYPILADKYHFLEINTVTKDTYMYTALLKKKISYWYQPASMMYFTSDLTYYADLATRLDSKRRPFLDQNLLMSQKSSMLDIFLWTGYYHNLWYLKSIQQRIEDKQKIGIWHYLLIGRSYSSLYFLPFNKSVWRLKKNPNFLGHPTKYGTKYLSALPHDLTKELLRNIFDGGIIRAAYADKIINNSKK